MTEFSGDISKLKDSFISEGPSSVGFDLDEGKVRIKVIKVGGLILSCVSSVACRFVCRKLLVPLSCFMPQKLANDLHPIQEKQ